MKKVKNMFLIMLSVFLLTGCVKFNSSMTINKDKSMDFEVDLLYANKLAEMGGEVNDEFDTKEYTDLGYKVNTEKQGDYSGYKLTKSFKSIDDISSETTEKASFSDFISKKDVVIFKKKKGLFKDTYTAVLTFDSSEMTGGLDDETMTGDITDETTEATDLEETDVTQDGTDLEGTDTVTETTEETTESSSEDLDQLGDLTGLMNEMEMKLVVNLPYGAKSNNATEKSDDNKKLTWNLLTQNGETTINFEFDMLNMTMIIIVIAAGVVIVAAVVVVLLVLKKKKANKDTLIHADYDPSIASQVDNNAASNVVTTTETSAPAVEQAAPVAPVAEPAAPVAPAVDPMMGPAPIEPQNIAPTNIDANGQNNIM